MSFRYKMVSTEDVAKGIHRLDCNKSPGTDQIRVRDLKLIKNSISPVIAKFINMCLKKGVYPNELKKAIIRAIHKQGSHQEYTNYRPIAILNLLNKITEKLIVKQVSDPLKKKILFLMYSTGLDQTEVQTWHYQNLRMTLTPRLVIKN